MILCILKIFLEKSWIIVSVTLIAGIGAYFYTQQHIEKKYSSEAKLYIGGAGNIVNHAEAMKTEMVGSMVSYNLLLHDLGDDAPFRESNMWPLSPGEKAAVQTTLQEKLASFELLSARGDDTERIIMNMLDSKQYNVSRWIADRDLVIEPTRATNLRVEFRSESPSLSAFVANMLCEEYIRYNNYINNTGVPGDSTRILNRLKIRMKEELAQKTERLEEVKAAKAADAPRVASRVRSDPEKDRRRRLQYQYEMERRDAEYRVSELENTIKNLDAKIAGYKAPSAPDNSARQQKLDELKQKIAELEKIFKENGSNDASLAGTIGELRARMQTETKKLASESQGAGQPAGELKKLQDDKRKATVDYDRAREELAAVRRKMFRLQREKEAGPAPPQKTEPDNAATVALLEEDREKALREYRIISERLEAENHKPANAAGEIKLVKRGGPGVEAESSEATTLISVVMGATAVLCMAIIGLASRPRIIRSMIYPDFSTYR